MVSAGTRAASAGWGGGAVLAAGFPGGVCRVRWSVSRHSSPTRLSGGPEQGLHQANCGLGEYRGPGGPFSRRTPLEIAGKSAWSVVSPGHSP